MADYIGLYFASDETEVSAQGVYTNALSIEVRADLNEESDPVELFAEAVEGFLVYDTEIFLNGDNADKWRIAETAEGLEAAEWGASLNIGLVENGILNGYFICRGFG